MVRWVTLKGKIGGDCPPILQPANYLSGGVSTLHQRYQLAIVR